MKRRVSGVSQADKAYRAFSDETANSASPYSTYGQQHGYSHPYFAQAPPQKGQLQYPYQHSAPSPYTSSSSSSSNNINIGVVQGDEKKRHSQLNKQKKLTTVSRTVRAFRRIFIAACFILVGLQVGRFICNKGFATSNFILFDTFDLSPIIGIYYHNFGAQTCRPDMYYWNGIELTATASHSKSSSGGSDDPNDTNQDDDDEDDDDTMTFDCTFNLCSVTQGKEGRIYGGSCTAFSHIAKGRVTHPVIMKSMNQRVGPWLKHEIAASQVIGKRTALQHYAHGFNFLLMSQLVEYRAVYDAHLDKSVPPLQLPNFLHQEGLQIMQQLRYLHGQGYLHLDVCASNIMFQPHATPEGWDFQLVDFSSARPVAQVNDIIQESMQKHFHLPKMPAMACLLEDNDNDNNNKNTEKAETKNTGQRGRLGGVPAVATSPSINDYEKILAEYCTGQVANVIRQQQLCPGFLDAYPLAIRLLRDLYTLTLNRPWGPKRLEKNKNPTFADILHKHEEYMEILRIVETEHGQDHPTVQLIAEWTDISRLNSTLVCGDRDHGRKGSTKNQR